MPTVCKAADLKIGDVIQVSFSGPYLSGTVYKITDNGVCVIRPFITFHDRIASDSRMSPLIGTEKMFFSKSETVHLWERVNGSMPTGRKIDVCLDGNNCKFRERFNRYMRDIEQNTRELNEGE